MGYETAKIITEEGQRVFGRYYSIYRGIVVDNNDNRKEDEQGKKYVYQK